MTSPHHNEEQLEQIKRLAKKIELGEDIAPTKNYDKPRVAITLYSFELADLVNFVAQATRTAVVEAEQNANHRFEAALGAGHEVREAGAMSEYEDGFDHGWDMHAEAARKHWYAQLSTEATE